MTRLMTEHRELVSSEEGFTIIEILVALTIFAFGLLGVAQMQISAMRGNGKALAVNEASTLLMSWADELKMRNFDSPMLEDANGNGRAGFLDENELADWQMPVNRGGIPFVVFGNVDADDNDYRVVRLIARWGPEGAHKRITLDTVIPRK